MDGIKVVQWSVQSPLARCGVEGSREYTGFGAEGRDAHPQVQEAKIACHVPILEVSYIW